MSFCLWPSHVADAIVDSRGSQRRLPRRAWQEPHTPSRLMSGRHVRVPVRPTSIRRFALIPALASLTALAACSAPDEPTAPSATSLTPPTPSAAISDGSQGNGDAHFFWLPPIAPSRTYPGTFDPGLQPEIRICRLAALPCSNPLVTFR